MAGKNPQAGKPPPQGNKPSASGKRPAITIDSSFEEKPQAKRAAARVALSRERGEGRVTPTSRLIFGSIIGVVLGVPVIVVIWLTLLSTRDDPMRFPPERIREAKTNAQVIGQRARAAYERSPTTFPANPTFVNIGLSQEALAGQFSLTYEVSFLHPALTVVVPNVFAQTPRELVMVVNLETGAETFNRD